MILHLIIPIIQLQFNTGQASQNVGNQDDEELPGKTYLVGIEETFKLCLLQHVCLCRPFSETQPREQARDW